MRIVKYNGGIGAILCNKCNVIVKENLTQEDMDCEDDVLCNKCRAIALINLNLMDFAEPGKVYWLYNDFGKFHPVPMAGKRAQAFIDARNQCKGGRWYLVSPEDYQKWFDEKGKHLEYLESLK